MKRCQEKQMFSSSSSIPPFLSLSLSLSLSHTHTHTHKHTFPPHFIVFFSLFLFLWFFILSSIPFFSQSLFYLFPLFYFTFLLVSFLPLSNLSSFSLFLLICSLFLPFHISVFPSSLSLSLSLSNLSLLSSSLFLFFHFSISTTWHRRNRDIYVGFSKYKPTIKFNILHRCTFLDDVFKISLTLKYKNPNSFEKKKIT